MLTTILGITTQFLLIKSVTSKDRKRSLIAQGAGCFSEGFYCFAIGAFTGGIIGFLNVFRSLLFTKSKKFSPKLYKSLLIFFCLIILISCSLTWGGVSSVIMTAASLFRTYALWQPKMSINRISGVIVGISCGIYYAMFGGWVMAAGCVALLAFSVHAVYKHDFKKPYTNKIIAQANS